MDKEKIIEENMKEIAGGTSETDPSCRDAVTDRPVIICKFKGKTTMCPYSPLARIYIDCGGCQAEKFD